ncbi:pollen-specific leucine-rich repeat extensin-like protein 3 [Salvia miltiorrhiza]|uniref:pollen-specific leucine-rich repeat extensin-like protein 3 n=1 Tax=Salvia miltiorrhiza TaxID=226208 RepID=UPI0025ACEFDF|nr:pollen-specific leucine-rich repeat extensin-like protein 3 [Salvia miltiorrhiza]
MGLRVKFLVIGVFLLSTLGSCRAKSATVKVVGLLHCIKNGSSCSNSSLGFEVMVRCKANEMMAQGNGGVDERGKFNVTLSAEIAGDSSATDGCYAKLQSRSGAPCHIQAAQAASVKILTHSAATQAVNVSAPTVIKFSPITCQSAFFWPFPNITFFGSPPPPAPEYTPPLENSTPPQPSYNAPAPSLPPPELEAPSPSPALAPPPTYRNPTNPTIRRPSPPPQAPPPQIPPPTSTPVYSRPSPPPLPAAAAATPLNGPIQSLTPPGQTPNSAPPPAVIAPAPPTRASSAAAAPSAGISIPPRRRRPSPIPRAPPIPRLPVTPSVPRKYFNPPKSRTKPPSSV